MNRVTESRDKLPELQNIERYTDIVYYELGNPRNALEHEAVSAYDDRQWDECKRICLCDPCNSYLACLSCLASAMRSPMIADSVLRDAARHVSEVQKERCARRIAEAFQTI